MNAREQKKTLKMKEEFLARGGTEQEIIKASKGFKEMVIPFFTSKEKESFLNIHKEDENGI